jgi:outer membrane immunogenic protein
MTAEWFMKRVLLLAAMSAIGGNAIAADLSPPVAYPPHAPATYIPIAPAYYYSWTGVYIGGNLGVGWSGSGGISDTFGSTFSTMTNTQFLGGVQFGVNYEFQEASWLALRPCSMGFQILETQ